MPPVWYFGPTRERRSDNSGPDGTVTTALAARYAWRGITVRF